MNVNALKAEIVRNGYTMAQVAKLIGISETTMSRRLKKQDFGLDEAQRLIDVLHIQNPGEIFLPKN
ncbi:MAG: helix-turn-helix transcriptional regulator [Oscillospiraceae bacterium]|nr:helix-turn-helix transcriptional regulator [Oscillospiraceae bacterium]